MSHIHTSICTWNTRLHVIQNRPLFKKIKTQTRLEIKVEEALKGHFQVSTHES